MQHILQTVTTYLWPAFLLVIGFGFVIFVHELGHFLMAKAVGIRVTQFAIGFGPGLLAWRKGLGLRVGSTEAEYKKRIEQYLAQQGATPRTESLRMRAEEFTDAEGSSELPDYAPSDIDRADQALGLSETEYRVNLVFLLGGYVKMLGQEDFKPNAASEDPRAFNRKPIWARAAVISAGVVMNVIFALVFFIVAFMHGVDFNAPIVGDVAPDSPAALTFAQGHSGDLDFRGLRLGDRILSLNGKSVHDLQDVKITTALANPKEPLLVLVERPGLAKPLQFSMTPQVGPQGLQWLGVEPSVSLTLAQSLDFSLLPQPLGAQLAQAGVEPGMRIVAVAGQPVKTFEQYNTALAAARGQPLAVTFASGDGRQTTLPLAAEPQPLFHPTPDGRVAHYLGLLPATVITDVIANSPAEAAGLKPRDLLVSLNDHDWPATYRVPSLVQQADGPIRLTVRREGKLLDLVATPNRQGQLGFYFQRCQEPLIAGALPDSPGAALRLTPGSRLLAINGQPVADLPAVQRILWQLASQNPAGFDLAVQYQLNVKDQPVETATVHVDAPLAAELAHTLWLQPLPPGLFDYHMVTLKARSPAHAVGLGFVKTHQYMLQVYLTLARLFQGSVPASQLQGPVGIFHTGTILAEKGGAYLLFFLGLISVNLAVINFLPIPIVDGGHMVFLAIEKIKGSPVSPGVQTAALYVGLAIIISVLLFTLYNDVARLAGA